MQGPMPRRGKRIRQLMSIKGDLALSCADELNSPGPPGA